MALDNGQELRLLQALRRQVQVWLHLRCHLQKGEFKGDDGDVAFKISNIQYRKLDFEEISAAAISVYQMEGLETWKQHARQAYEFFDKEGNRPIVIDELASVYIDP
ncbi:hypothetical protein OsI_21154 [Oryza sativa Indica Group]|uniref:EF-hand domain-containing protein n=1 Tax=Oryza sativa subsp. indica TaxID=39946 RepID=A2Y7Y6_ORYSI|nr:hypothetical protein OsI_21152 [Oryza sativa Indica Group]EEC79763.1 hypothetical protein OsI_21154 [Oryza sativa Indica Group]